VKVLHVNTYDQEGGAARSTYRFMTAMRQHGHDAKFVALRRERDDPNVIGPTTPLAKLRAMARGPIDKLPLRKYPNRKGLFSPSWVPDKVPQQIEALDPDVVHLGWICGGFLKIESLPKIKRPVVWTPRDMWAFTGGCHYSGECTKYETGCGACPVLGSDRARDLSHKCFQRKLQAWREWDFTLVTMTRWLAETATSSPIFAGREVTVIPWCLDLDMYKPVEKCVSRELLNLPQDHDIILFGSIAATSDKNKGYDLVLEALKHLKAMHPPRPIQLVVFGASHGAKPQDIPFPVRFLGHLHDDVALRLAYSAADVMTVPSRQEAFGQTTTESLACGTPVVAWAATGLLDTVEHGFCGYLAKPYEPEDLARGFYEVFISKGGRPPGQDGVFSNYAELSANARAHAEKNFNPSRIVGMYTEVFERTIERFRSKEGRRGRS
jgi:glycosyltransferase involved in cell wall biosynthesis